MHGQEREEQLALVGVVYSRNNNAEIHMFYSAFVRVLPNGEEIERDIYVVGEDLINNSKFTVECEQTNRFEPPYRFLSIPDPSDYSTIIRPTSQPPANPDLHSAVLGQQRIWLLTNKSGILSEFLAGPTDDNTKHHHHRGWAQTTIHCKAACLPGCLPRMILHERFLVDLEAFVENYFLIEYSNNCKFPTKFKKVERENILERCMYGGNSSCRRNSSGLLVELPG